MNNKVKEKVLTVLMIFVIIACLGVTAGLFASANVSPADSDKVEKTNSFKGKYVSFLGDSITTFEHWSNNGNANSSISGNGFYYSSDDMSASDTWWFQVVKALELNLCVNNSWDGARVTDTKEGIPSGSERAVQLHNDVSGIYPDIIVIYLGTNDLGNGISSSDFESAYSNMLRVIQTKYPAADVYCCTLLEESRNANNSTGLAEYNQLIRELAEDKGYGVIDFYQDIPGWNYLTDTINDGTLRVHPTAEAMKKLSECAISSIKDQ